MKIPHACGLDITLQRKLKLVKGMARNELPHRYENLCFFFWSKVLEPNFKNMAQNFHFDLKEGAFFLSTFKF
jgi:hypothetical protein